MTQKLEDPIRLLRRDHDAVLDVLDGMECAVADVRGPRRNEALQSLRQGLEFLDREVGRHMQLEERGLYPALRRHVPAATVDVMLEEHRDIAWAMDLLRRALARDHENDIRWHATALVDLLRRHIDQENNVLFMMTAQMLSDAEYAELARALQALVEGKPT